MTRNSLILLATAGSAALLGGAFAFEYLGGLLPCVLCIYQRWPHALAIVLGLLGLKFGGKALPLLGMLAALTTAAIGVFHVGVEQMWWEGLATCTVNSLEGVSGADLLNTDISVGAPVRCDAIAWQFMGVSMAGWNAVISLFLAAVWLRAARRS